VNVKWKFHVIKGYWEFQRQAAVGEALLARGEAIAAAAGDGVEAELTPRQAGRRGTPVVRVRTVTNEARESEAQSRTLTRALDAGRQ
jgi:hypothetical protein